MSKAYFTHSGFCRPVCVGLFDAEVTNRLQGLKDIT